MTSVLDESIKLRVRISHPPEFCGYSANVNSLPCFHNISVLCEKYGASNIYRFTANRHLTGIWRNSYGIVLFLLPSQSDVDNVISNSRLSVISGDILAFRKLYHLHMDGLSRMPGLVDRVGLNDVQRFERSEAIAILYVIEKAMFPHNVSSVNLSGRVVLM